MKRNSYIYVFMVASFMTGSVSCMKKSMPDTEGDDRIAFYVKAAPAAGPSSRHIVEDTETLVQQRFPIYVTDGLTNPAFTDTKIDYTNNGVWKSNVNWTDKDYTLYAYIASPKSDPYPSGGNTGNVTIGGVSGITNNGSNLQIQQPDIYSKDDGIWADYLMSYRIRVNGAKKPLVKLDFERITCCVELYMAMGTNMSEVTVKKIEFRNINTKASYALKYHAVPDDNNDASGMKNTWAVTVDESLHSTYSFSPSTDIEGKLKHYDTETRFSQNNLKMRFLAVQQDVIDKEIYIEYNVLENGSISEYTATFNLADYNPVIWSRGHKIRYFIGIDSSVDLEGSIEEWKTVEFIETTLLPE